ncbi:hypothetical protein [Rhodococcus koreensis]
MDPDFANVMSRQLGPAFETIPGVARIKGAAPAIAVHDTYHAAQGQGLSIIAPPAN